MIPVIKNVAFYWLLLFLVISCSDISKSDLTQDCPYKEITSFSQEFTQLNGSEHNGQIGIAIRSNLKILGSLNFTIGDSIQIYDNLEKKVSTSEMTYTAEQVFDHNRIISIICGIHKQWEASGDSLYKSELQVTLNEMVKSYYRFLIDSLPFSTEKRNHPQEKIRGESKTVVATPPVQLSAVINLTVDYQYTNAQIKVNGQTIVVDRNGNTLTIEAIVPPGKCVVEVIPEHENPCKGVSFNITRDTIINKNFRCY